MADSQLHQRVVHTQLFKLIELDDGPHRKTELWISEADWMGRARLRNLEQFFYGIVGHVKDRRGYSIYGWREASRMANYWRRHFAAPEVPYEHHQTEPHQELEPTDNSENQMNQEDDAADDTSTVGNPPQAPLVPLQVRSPMMMIRACRVVHTVQRRLITFFPGIWIIRSETSWQDIFHLISHASSKKAPRQRGVCVNHLKRCKTS